MVGQEIVSSELGLVTYIDFGETVVFEHRYYDQESEGAYTGFGWALMILTAMFSVRIGLAVYHGNWRGGVPRKSEIDFLAWVYGLLAFALFAALLDYVLGHEPGIAQTAKYLLHLGVIALLAKVMYDWRNKHHRDFDRRLRSR
jgi:hypothetical protein